MSFLQLRIRFLLIPFSAALQIAHLQKKSVGFRSDTVERIEPPLHLPFDPSELEYTKVVDPFEALERTRYWHARKRTDSVAKAELNVLDTRIPSNVIDNEEAQSESAQIRGTGGFRSETPSTVDASNMGAAEEQQFSDLPGPDSAELDESFNTQSSNVQPFKRQFRNVMQAEHMTQGDTQTQWFGSQQRIEKVTPPTTNQDRSENGDVDVVRCQCRAKEADDAMVSYASHVLRSQSLTFNLRCGANLAIVCNIFIATASLAQTTNACHVTTPAISAFSRRLRKNDSKRSANSLLEDEVCILQRSMA